MKEEVSKTQAIRLLDVFAVGPVLIYAGVKAKTLNPLVRVALAATGAGTILFNGRNYLLQEELEKEGRLRATILPTVQYTVEDEG